MLNLLYAISSEARMELRKGYVLGGLLVFVLCVVYIIYLTIEQMPPAIWLALYWIAFLFLGVNTTLKSFASESSRRYLYYYTLMSPELLFLSKCIYNLLVQLVLGLLMYATMWLILGNPVVNRGLFVLAIILGAAGIALAFTFVSGIAIKSDQGATLMTILSFPVIIPILLSLVRISQAALMPAGMAEVSGTISILVAIDLLLIGLAFLLFPYLWRS